VLNIRQIEIFKAIMEAGSISEAARRLHVSQPSVSKHLAAMEERLGMTLFARTGNRLVPKPEAQALFTQIEQVYSGVERINRFVDDLSQNRHGEILLAAMPLIAHRWLPRVIADFMKAHSKVSASLPVRSSLWINRWVAAGRVDLGIAIEGNERGVDSETLMTLPMVVAMPRDHPMAIRHGAGAEAVDAAELSGESIVTLSNFDYHQNFIDNLLDQRVTRPERRIQTFTTYVACELACRGLGLAVVDALTASEFSERGLTWRPLKDAPSLDIRLLSSAHWPATTLTENLMSLIRENAAATTAKLEALMGGR
jgi:molybdate transport repressor ModE-like protein